MTARTRVLLADDHALVRAGVRALLQAIPHVEVIAEAAQGHEALELIRTRRPDVAVVAIGLPRLNGMELARRVMQERNPVRIVLLTMDAHQEYVRQAVRAGVAAVLLKDGAPRELRLAIDAAMRGDTYLAPSISRQILDACRAKAWAGAGSLDGLTRREREVLELSAEGLATNEIAYVLNLSADTVAAHLASLRHRLDGLRGESVSTPDE